MKYLAYIFFMLARVLAKYEGPVLQVRSTLCPRVPGRLGNGPSYLAKTHRGYLARSPARYFKHKSAFR